MARLLSLTVAPMAAAIQLRHGAKQTIPRWHPGIRGGMRSPAQVMRSLRLYCQKLGPQFQ
jgi:hypothetical protein